MTFDGESFTLHVEEPEEDMVPDLDLIEEEEEDLDKALD